MYRKADILFLMNQSPMHAGSGDSLGIVDLPIQRERHTGFPKIEASSLKGAIREAFEDFLVLRQSDKETAEENLKKINIAFGFDEAQVGSFTKESIKKMFSKNGKDVSEFAGALGFTDARLLLFPVKSMKGVFAWVTCPQILQKFNDELALAGQEKLFDNIPDGNYIAEDNKSLRFENDKIILEEYTFELKENDNINELGNFLAETIFGKDNNSFFAQKIKTDIVILSNDNFRDFVNLSTEVITRTKIDNATGTVVDGALFTEEYLPAESLMYSLALTAPEFSKEKDKTFAKAENLQTFVKNCFAENEIIQIGGNATLGKGITKVKML